MAIDKTKRIKHLRKEILDISTTMEEIIISGNQGEAEELYACMEDMTHELNQLEFELYG